MRRPVRRARRGAAGGFTLVEVLAALTLLAIGLLGLAGLAGRAAVAVRGGAAQTRASAVAQSRFDSLASVSCGQIAAAIPAGQTAATGVASARGVTELWTARFENDSNMVRATTAITVAGRAATYHYVSMRACR